MGNMETFIRSLIEYRVKNKQNERAKTARNDNISILPYIYKAQELLKPKVDEEIRHTRKDGDQNGVSI